VVETAVRETPRLYRRRDGRLVAGVAAGIATHLGLPALAVRVAFVVLLVLNGLGALLYAAFWAVLPAAPEQLRREPRRLLKLLGFVALAFLALIIRGVLGDGAEEPASAAVGWLFALIAVGAGIIWHQTAGVDQRRTGSDASWLSAFLTERGRRAYLVRLIAGGALIVVGAVGLAVALVPVAGASVASVINGLLFALLAVAGVGLVAAPLLWRMFGALREEREARIREQERAEFAAMVHDQVLHTLALIQRSAATGSTAHRLARAQERTLRTWLYKPAGSPAEKLAAALEQAAGEVEDAYGVTVEAVVVGDAQTDEQVGALVAASREALVNAARHAAVATVSLYAEVEPEQVTVFVRDRGVGFDPAEVDPSRHGVRGSIIGRMERHGGKAEIVSTPGEGTEVRLSMPLTADRGGDDG
jgi:signal transduction histidine kinase